MNYFKFASMAKSANITKKRQGSVAAAKKRATSGHARKKTASKRLNVSVQRVLPLGNAWVVKADQAKDFSVVTTLLSEAVKIATSLAKHEHALLVIHNKNGSIKREVSYAVPVKRKRAS